MKSNDNILKVLEEIPLIPMAFFRVTEDIEEIKIKNIKAESFSEGYKKAIDDIKEWRNKKYLELKNLL